MALPLLQIVLSSGVVRCTLVVQEQQDIFRYATNRYITGIKWCGWLCACPNCHCKSPLHWHHVHNTKTEREGPMWVVLTNGRGNGAAHTSSVPIQHASVRSQHFMGCQQLQSVSCASTGPWPNRLGTPPCRWGYLKASQKELCKATLRPAQMARLNT